MNIDFVGLNQYLYHQSEGQAIGELQKFVACATGRVKYPLLNPKNKTSSVFLASEQFFSTGGLSIALVAKNTFKDPDEQPTGVQVGVRLFATAKKPQGGYCSPTDKNGSIGLTLTFDEAAELYRNLGTRSGFFEANRRLEGQQAVYLRIRSSDGRGGLSIERGGLRVDVALSAHAIVALKTYILGMYKVKYPSLSDLILSHFLRSGFDANAESNHELVEQPKVGGVQQSTDPQRKAVYAIWNQNFKERFPIGVLQQVQQECDYRELDEVIREFNSGNQMPFVWLLSRKTANGDSYDQG